MKQITKAVLLLGLTFVLISADKGVLPDKSHYTLHAHEVWEPEPGRSPTGSPGKPVMVVEAREEDAKAKPGTGFCVKIPGTEEGFKPFDSEEAVLMSADGKTCAFMEKFATKNYRCDCVALAKDGTLLVYSDINGKLKPFLDAKHLPVDAESLMIYGLASHTISLGGVIVCINGVQKAFYVDVLLKPDGAVEVVKFWFEDLE